MEINVSSLKEIKNWKRIKKRRYVISLDNFFRILMLSKNIHLDNKKRVVVYLWSLL